jgi:Heterokaryon incompatibility protein (HET)
MTSILATIRTELGVRCPNCSTTIDAVLRETRTIRLGDLGYLTFNPVCSLCGFFSSLCQSISADSDEAILDARSWMRQTRFRLWVNTSGETANRSMDVGAFHILFMDGSLQMRDVYVRICRAENIDRPALGSWFPSRWTFPDPVPTIKRWIASCAEHQHDLDWLNTVPEGKSHSRPKYIHLVDCIAACVAKREFKDDLGYAALSYVWGRSQQLKLLTTNYNTLLKNGSLSPKQQYLPRSIRDAMDLCNQLGIRDLWIDCLCIIQDSTEDKAEQIKNMDRIYRRAIVTIASAAGHDADGGLPAFRHDSMALSRSMSVRGLHLYEWKNTWTALSPSRPKWLTRGWTFQEAALSERILIFTSDTVYLCCSEAILLFDPLSGNLRTSDDIDLSLFPSTQTFHVRNQENASTAYDYFIHALESYIQRSLGMQEDGIHAFTGILNALGPKLGLCWHGCPVRAFPSCIMHSSYQDAPHERNPNFPSWSWAGWAMNRTLISISGVQAAVPFYRFDGPGHLEQLPRHGFGWYSEEDGSVEAFPMEDPTPSELRDVENWLNQDSAVPLDHLLVFWAYEIQRCIRKDPDVQRPHSYYLVNESTDDQTHTFEIKLQDTYLKKSEREKMSFIVFALSASSGLPQPMMIERVRGVAYRVDFVTPASYPTMEMWKAMRPVRKLVVMG